MQNNQMPTVRGYNPQQNTGSMNPLPYQPMTTQQELPPIERLKSLWNQLDPAAVALLAALLLGIAYALYATISFWWLTQILVHLILVWLTVAINGAALFTGKREMMLFSGIGYGLSMLLFLNYFYLLLPQLLLCLWGWAKYEE